MHTSQKLGENSDFLHELATVNEVGAFVFLLCICTFALFSNREKYNSFPCSSLVVFNLKAPTQSNSLDSDAVVGHTVSLYISLLRPFVFKVSFW